jgi:hypothetical protein
VSLGVSELLIICPTRRGRARRLPCVTYPPLPQGDATRRAPRNATSALTSMLRRQSRRTTMQRTSHAKNGGSPLILGVEQTPGDAAASDARRGAVQSRDGGIA